MPCAIGIDIGGTFLKAGLVTASGELQHFLQLPTEAEQGPDSVIARLAEAVEALSARAPEPVVGIGIGCAGHVDAAGQRVSYPPNFPGWTVVPLVDRLRERLLFAGPILLDNDANAAARGEAAFGAGRGLKHFLLITLGTGVGGAVVLDGKVWRGLSGGAGEFGHTTIHYRGPRCNCGARGCIEAYVGEAYLKRQVRLLLRRHPESALFPLLASRRKIRIHDLLEAARSGDALAQQILTRAGRRLGYALVNVVHLLDIRTVLIGGGASHAGEWILEPVREALLERLMPPFREGIELRLAALGNRAGVLGAAQLVFEQTG
jgi:glucokinase